MAKVDESTCSTATRQFAARLYGAYVHNSDGLNYQGLPCPPWDELPPAVRGHWCAVALVADVRLKGVSLTKVCVCNPAVSHDGLCLECGGRSA